MTGDGGMDASAGRTRRITTILFDLDGTLVSTRRLYLEAYRRALEPDVGRLLDDDALLALRPRSETRLLREQVGADRFDACFERFQRHYRDLHASHFDGVYPGVPDLLDTLRARGLALGIVTGKSRRSWETTAAVCALGPFDVLVLDDDVAAPKPDPEGILRALRLLGRAPAEAVYVGDTLGDVMAAAAAGVRPAAALWAHSPTWRARFLERIRPHRAAPLESPARLLDLLG